MKLTRRKLRSLILRAVNESATKRLNEGWSGQAFVDAAIEAGRELLPGTQNANLTDEQRKLIAQDAETKQLMVMFSKKRMWAAGHQATINDALTRNDTQLVTLANHLERFVRPKNAGPRNSPQAAIPAANLRLDTGAGNSSIYSFATTGGTPNARRNFALANISSLTDVVRYMQQCHATGPATGFAFPINPGEKLEVGMAAAIAYFLPGVSAGARQDKAAGKDIDILSGWASSAGINPYFELKFSDDESGEINTLVGASPPRRQDIDKFYIFLSSDRSYLVQASILAGIMQADSAGAPIDVSVAENAAMGASLVRTLIDDAELQAEFTRIITSTAATVSPTPTGFNLFTSELIDAIVDSINTKPQYIQYNDLYLHSLLKVLLLKLFAFRALGFQ